MNAVVVLLMLTVAAEPSDADKKKYEEAARAAINVTGPAIDACTARYLEENPAGEGKVKVSIKIVKGGVVSSALIETELGQARSLRDCLERVARGWRFPPPQTEEPDALELAIPVKKGTPKFKIYGPNETPPPGAQDQPSGFLQFTPNFLRGYGEKGQE